jgi:hypothetical protein
MQFRNKDDDEEDEDEDVDGFCEPHDWFAYESRSRP